MPVEIFTPYEKVVSKKPLLTGNIFGEIQYYKIASGKKISEDKAEKYKASEVRKTLKPEKHSIVYYVNKDNPLGDDLPNFKDPMLRRWEEALNQDFENEFPINVP